MLNASMVKEHTIFRSLYFLVANSKHRDCNCLCRHMTSSSSCCLRSFWACRATAKALLLVFKETLKNDEVSGFVLKRRDKFRRITLQFIFLVWHWFGFQFNSVTFFDLLSILFLTFDAAAAERLDPFNDAIVLPCSVSISRWWRWIIGDLKKKKKSIVSSWNRSETRAEFKIITLASFISSFFNGNCQKLLSA